MRISYRQIWVGKFYIYYQFSDVAENLIEILAFDLAYLVENLQQLLSDKIFSKIWEK